MKDNFLPVIDYNKPEDEAAEELYKALSTVGFACLTGTGIIPQVKEYRDEATRFFHLPTGTKMDYRQKDPFVGGWFPIGTLRTVKEGPYDYREGANMPLRAKEHYKSSSHDSPLELLMGDQCWRLWDSFKQIAKRVTYLIGLGLKLENPHTISNAHRFSDRGGGLLRVNYYPPIDAKEVKEGQMRIGEHADFGSITLLFTDTPGLQVLNQVTGVYEDVPCVEDGLFINIGDILQIWSGDKLISNKHRVLVPTDEKYRHKERMSITFFCSPDDDTVLETLDGSGKYPPITAFEHIHAKIKSVTVSHQNENTADQDS